VVICENPYIRLKKPNSSAMVTAPMLGREKTTAPNATDTSPLTMNSPRVPAVSPAPNAARISDRPPAIAQNPTIRISTSAVGPGQARAVTPAARSISPSSRWPSTGPALRLLNARMPCSPAAANA
jgi:hypothetical protein